MARLGLAKPRSPVTLVVLALIVAVGSLAAAVVRHNSIFEQGESERSAQEVRLYRQIAQTLKDDEVAVWLSASTPAQALRQKEERDRSGAVEEFRLWSEECDAAMRHDLGAARVMTASEFASIPEAIRDVWICESLTAKKARDEAETTARTVKDGDLRIPIASAGIALGLCAFSLLLLLLFALPVVRRWRSFQFVEGFDAQRDDRIFLIAYRIAAAVGVLGGGFFIMVLYSRSKADAGHYAMIYCGIGLAAAGIFGLLYDSRTRRLLEQLPETAERIFAQIHTERDRLKAYATRLDENHASDAERQRIQIKLAGLEAFSTAGVNAVAKSLRRQSEYLSLLKQNNAPAAEVDRVAEAVAKERGELIALMRPLAGVLDLDSSTRPLLVESMIPRIEALDRYALVASACAFVVLTGILISK